MFINDLINNCNSQQHKKDIGENLSACNVENVANIVITCGIIIFQPQMQKYFYMKFAIHLEAIMWTIFSPIEIEMQKEW